MTGQAAFYPGRAPIDAYGNGGFRFAEMSHRGSLLCLPSGIYGWDYLKDLDANQDQYWQAYLAELKAANASRLPTIPVGQFTPPTKS